MLSKFRRTRVILIVMVLMVVLTLLTVVGARTEGPAVHSREDVITFTLDGLYDEEEVVGHSNLVRTSDGVQIQIKTNELIPGGVYTYWFLADEDGAVEEFPWELIIWADYVIVGSNGKDATNLKLETGEAGIADDPTVFIDDGEPGFNNPYRSGIEIEIVYHGQVEDLPDDPGEVEEWFTTFWAGDPDVCNLFLGMPVDPVCPLGQITFHAP